MGDNLQLTSAAIAKFKNAGFEIVGRYLTGTVGTGSNERPKNLTADEITAITSAGLSIFPIYEDGGYEEKYFTNSQGTTDGGMATAAARKLGFPEGTTIYFAVDVDIQDGDIDGTVTPYLKGVLAAVADSGYEVGVYGTRNVCLYAEKIGVKYSFVANMSYGWSGNLGFKMPSNWSFDQFTEYTAGSTGIDIDQDAASGKDQGVSKTTDTMTNKNSAFFEQLQKVEEQAKNYISDSTSIAERIAQFYRQFDYSSAEWIPIAGALDKVWLSTVNSALNISSDRDLKPLYDDATGIQIGVSHMMAALNALLFWRQSTSAAGVQDLAGWLGDLLTSISDALGDSKEYSSYYDSIAANVGRKASFGREDLIDDMDAVNLYSTIKTQESLSNGQTPAAVIKDYYIKGDNSARFNSYVANRFDDDFNQLQTNVYKLLIDDNSFGEGYSVALEAFKKHLMRFSSYTNDEAMAAAEAYRKLLEANV